MRSSIKPKPENLALLIYFIRGEKVLLDADLARLYGVEARALNQAVARNRNGFPADFLFRLSTEEYEGVRPKFLTAAEARDSNSSQSVMSSRKHQDYRESHSAMTDGLSEPDYLTSLAEILSQSVREMSAAVHRADPVRQGFAPIQAKGLDHSGRGQRRRWANSHSGAGLLLEGQTNCRVSHSQQAKPPHEA